MALKAIPFALCRESSGPFAVRVLATLMDVPVNVIIRPQQLVASPVCRCLFGPVDHDQNLRDLAKLRKVLDHQSSQRWNFDFRLERPISGERYGWESVDDENTNIHHTFNSSQFSGITNRLKREREVATDVSSAEIPPLKRSKLSDESHAPQEENTCYKRLNLVNDVNAFQTKDASTETDDTIGCSQGDAAVIDIESAKITSKALTSSTSVVEPGVNRKFLRQSRVAASTTRRASRKYRAIMALSSTSSRPLTDFYPVSKKESCRKRIQ